jgi:hypothetical protein
MLTSLTKLILLLTLINKNLGWNSTGHFIIARIAEMEIQKQSPVIYKGMIAILDVLDKFTVEKSHQFVESGTFLNDIKNTSVDLMHYWHSYDQAISFDKKLVPKDHRVEDQNIVWAINESKSTLRNKMSSAVDDFLGKSFSLRYVVHLVGDIHQPCHTGSLFSKDFTNEGGDKTATLFKIKYKEINNLHSLWDNILGLYDDLMAPLGDADWDKLNTYSQELVKKFPRNSFDDDRINEKSIREWQKEGNKVAKENVYKNISLNDTVSDQYIKDNTIIVKQQLTLAGYRLADLLLEIFNDPETYKRHFNRNESGIEYGKTVEEDLGMETENQEEIVSSEEEEVQKKPKNDVTPKKKRGRPAKPVVLEDSFKEAKPDKRRGRQVKDKKKVDESYEPEEDEISEDEENNNKRPKGLKLLRDENHSTIFKIMALVMLSLCF